MIALKGTDKAGTGSLPELADVGVCEDRIVKVVGEWWFASRTIVMDGSRWAAPAMESGR